MRKITLILISLLIGSVCFTQHVSTSTSTMQRRISWGLDVGVNVAKFDLDEKEFASPSLAPRTKNKTSFHAGAFFNIPIAAMVSLQPSIMYSRQGSNMEQEQRRFFGDDPRRSVEYDEDLAYLLVAPASLHILTKPGFIFETGPMLGYLLSAEQDGPAPYNSSSMRDSRNKLDLIWSAGVGFLTKVGVGVHARYNYGFSNVLKASGTTNPNGEAHNRVIQLGLMYHFGHHMNQ